MPMLKCKMCGQDIEADGSAVFCRCPACGTKQTVPPTDSAKMVERYMQANRLRRAADFDAAFDVYQSILAYSPTDAEAWWGKCLCRYGIDYVTDPATAQKKPTCHRTLTASIFEDEDYKQCIECADPVAKQMYADEAAEIDRVQKGILAIARKEQPYDVFICYKETDDETGERTQDSVLAQDVYYALVKEGYRVFFARVTLEKLLGEQYEPVIYAALTTARVMLVIGTRPEYFNAPWVKNEWRRFLALSKGDPDRLLIPCYRGMDPYELPEAMAPLQSQNMAKIGFLQDLLHGIGKVTGKQKASASAPRANPADTMTERAFILLGDRQFDKADALLDQVLNTDPHSARGYLGKLMVSLRADKPDALSKCKTPLQYSQNFRHALEYGDDPMDRQLEGYQKTVEATIERRLKEAYSLLSNQRFDEADGVFSDLLTGIAPAAPNAHGDLVFPAVDNSRARAFLGRFMAQRHIPSMDRITDQRTPLQKSKHFTDALACADAALKQTLSEKQRKVDQLIEQERLERERAEKKAADEALRRKLEKERAEKKAADEALRRKLINSLEPSNKSRAEKELDKCLQAIGQCLTEQEEKARTTTSRSKAGIRKLKVKRGVNLFFAVLLLLPPIAAAAFIVGCIITQIEHFQFGLLIVMIIFCAVIGAVGYWLFCLSLTLFASAKEIKSGFSEYTSEINTANALTASMIKVKSALEQEHKQIQEKQQMLLENVRSENSNSLGRLSAQTASFLNDIPIGTSALLTRAQQLTNGNYIAPKV